MRNHDYAEHHTDQKSALKCVQLSRTVAISPLNAERRKGGENKIHFAYGQSESPFGTLFCAHTEIGISSLEFETDTLDYQQWIVKLRQKYPAAAFTENMKRCQDAVSRALSFDDQHDDRQPAPRITLQLDASSFQIKVWQKLLNIEFGQLCSYQHIAQQIGQPKASRAVGNAVASNPVAVLIPCHRVIKSNGDWGQYRWGADRKLAIHEWERKRLR